MADYLEITPSNLPQAIKSFKGIRRRQEIIGEKRGILIIDDFAHHPTAVKETIDAVSQKYKNRRLITAFEPRSNSSRRNVFQSRYASSFVNANLVLIPEPTMMEKIPPEERFSSQQLVLDLKKMGLNASYFQNTDQLLKALLKEARKDDVILIMSNGAFDNLPRRLLKRLGNN
jgi:UDP-N-acetylmuramate: L-alanyl-gamma-D-glutamyl-meso-diaminopimelate ligase